MIFGDFSKINVYFIDLKDLKQVINLLNKFGIKVKNIEEVEYSGKLYRIKEVEGWNKGLDILKMLKK